MRMTKRLRKLRDEASELGVREVFFETTRNHLRMIGLCPDGSRLNMTLAMSPSCWRADRNTLAMLRRMVSRNDENINSILSPVREVT